MDICSLGRPFVLCSPPLSLHLLALPSAPTSHNVQRNSLNQGSYLSQMDKTIIQPNVSGTVDDTKPYLDSPGQVAGARTLSRPCRFRTAPHRTIERDRRQGGESVAGWFRP